jgi:hypothetical protein
MHTRTVALYIKMNNDTLQILQDVTIIPIISYLAILHQDQQLSPPSHSLRTPHSLLFMPSALPSVSIRKRSLLSIQLTFDFRLSIH